MNTEQRLSDWVSAHLVQILGVTPESIDFDKGISAYGIDSVDAVLMAGELEEVFGVEIDLAGFMQSASLQGIIVTLAAKINDSLKASASS